MVAVVVVAHQEFQLLHRAAAAEMALLITLAGLAQILEVAARLGVIVVPLEQVVDLVVRHFLAPGVVVVVQ